MTHAASLEPLPADRADRTERAPPIAVTAVHKTFAGGVRALDGATLTIAAGQRACLLGPNGAGKTTLLRVLTGALQPTLGSVALFGQAPDGPGFLAAKRRVGIVPQAPGMYRDVTAEQYLKLVQTLYDRGALGDVVDAFGLGPVLSKPMAALSGGYQRRLALAAALLPKPDLLLLDEPTVGLDPVAAREVLELLRAAMRGRTTLLCTHNLAEAEALCDTVVILRAGRVLRHEPIEQLRARVHPQVALAAAQGPTALAAAVAALGRTIRVEGAVVYAAVDDPRRDAPDVLRALLGAGLDVYECRVHVPSLEELLLDVLQNGAERP